MLAIKAVVKDGLIKPLESIDLPEGKEIVVYIPEEREEEEYSEWTDEEWQKFSLHSFMNTEDDKDVDWEDFFSVKKSESNIKKKQALQRKCWAMKRRMSGTLYEINRRDKNIHSENIGG